MVDDWDIIGANDVEEVISWAKKNQLNGPFEIFVIAGREGGDLDQRRLIRIYGVSADTPGAVEVVEFSSE